MKKRLSKFNISLIVQSFINLEKVYRDLKKILKDKESFLNNKMLFDKAKVEFNLAMENVLRPCRHISQAIGLKTTKYCLSELSEHLGFSNLSKSFKELTDVYFKTRDARETIESSAFYDTVSTNLESFKEYAKNIIDYVKKETNNPYLIDYDFLNEKAKYVKESVDKINFVISKPFEEFNSKPMYFDRVKYFYQVGYNALFEICKHLAPKFGVKNISDDCLYQLFSKEDETTKRISLDMMNLNNKLISTWEIKNEEFYEKLKELNPYFIVFLDKIKRQLKELQKS